MMKSIALCGLLTATLTCAAQTPPPPVDIIVERSLMITDLGVVEDPLRTDPNSPEGVWTFRHLMEQMAGDQDPAALALAWLRLWQQDQLVNGHTVSARPAIGPRVIDPWLARGGGRLDLATAPFKLLAIVGRLDLRVHDRRRVSSAGEGRLIFGVTDPSGRPLPPVAAPNPGGFVVIFEYDLVADDMDDLRRWAEDFANLSRSLPGSAQYNAALATLTRRFTDAGAAPGRVNGSALNQIRTNEASLDGAWELREHLLDPTNGRLRLAPVADTPDTLTFNGTTQLADLINANRRRLLAGTFKLGESWRAGASNAGPFRLSDFSDAPARTFTVNPLVADFNDIPWSAADISDNDARHAFALDTCNGCHRDETATAFLHVGFPQDHQLPATLGQPAELSGYLTGIEVADPVDPSQLRTFSELELRRADLAELLRQLREDPRGPAGPQQPRRVH